MSEMHCSHQAMAASRFFKNIGHFETSVECLQEAMTMSPCARSDGQVMMTETQTITRANDTILLNHLFHTKTPIKVDHLDTTTYHLYHSLDKIKRKIGVIN